MTAATERCGFLVQYSESFIIGEPGLYRVSKDGWCEYVREKDWNEIGFEHDDVVFETYFSARMRSALRERELARSGINT